MVMLINEAQELLISMSMVQLMLVAHQAHSVSNPLSVDGDWFGRCTGSQSPTVASQAFISYSVGYVFNVAFISHLNIISFPSLGES